MLRCLHTQQARRRIKVAQRDVVERPSRFSKVSQNGGDLSNPILGTVSVRSAYDTTRVTERSKKSEIT